MNDCKLSVRMKIRGWILYETREKAVRDYNQMMKGARHHGLEDGIKIGEERGREAGKREGIIEVAKNLLAKKNPLYA